MPSDMGVDKDKKIDRKVMEYQDGSELAKKIKEEEEKPNRYAVFDHVFYDAFRAAKDMYTEDGKDLDSVIDEYIKWLEKCKGKESELMKTALAEDEEEESEEDED